MASDQKIKVWLPNARALLEHSLGRVPHELNELDWKSDLSPDTKRLAEHLSAFSNCTNGGYLAFGVEPTGKPVGIHDAPKVEAIISKLTNIAREGVDPPAQIDHVVDDFRGAPILFVHVYESAEKPVHIRGKGIEESFIRVGGHTRKMSKQELAQALMTSRVPKYEELEAFFSTSPDEVLAKLDYEELYGVQKRQKPSTPEKILEDLVAQKLVTNRKGGGYAVTNLGVLVCAKNTEEHPSHERRGVRVIVYRGKSRATEAIGERVGKRGYATGFEGLLKYVLGQIPSHEVIEGGFRRQVYAYPPIAIREFLANALVHQDLSFDTSSPLVEIFEDRLEITNPGRLLPEINIERLIDITTQSRNESLARFMRLIGICEERGSGIDKAIEAVEQAGLPPVGFLEKDNSFKVTLFMPKKFKDMSREERILAAYQHCCIRFEANAKMTNSTLRERLGISEKNYPMVSRIIREAIEAGKIKKADPTLKAKSHMEYIPYWA